MNCLVKLLCCHYIFHPFVSHIFYEHVTTSPLKLLNYGILLEQMKYLLSDYLFVRLIFSFIVHRSFVFPHWVQRTQFCSHSIVQNKKKIVEPNYFTGSKRAWNENSIYILIKGLCCYQQCRSLHSLTMFARFMAKNTFGTDVI